MKFFRIIAIALIIIIAIIFTKFRPAYAVSLNGEEIGYVGDEEDFENQVNENILKSEEEKVAFVELEKVDYSFSLVSRNQINDESVLATLADNAKNVYRVYEVSDLNNAEVKAYANSIEEAEEIKQELADTKEHLDSKEYIEDVAREKLDMYLPNEKVYIDISK